jgi:hypothetical protein
MKRSLNIGLLFIVQFALLLALLAPVSAFAHDDEEIWIDYFGYHPIPEAYGGGFCEREDRHQHEFAPVEIEFYNVVDGVYYFVGDPSAYGYEDELYWYQYHHPVPTYWGGGYCYLVGPHRHWWVPWGGYFVLTNGYYHYRGPWGPRYHKHRHSYHHHKKAKKILGKKTFKNASVKAGKSKPAIGTPARKSKAVRRWKPTRRGRAGTRRYQGTPGKMKAHPKKRVPAKAHHRRSDRKKQTRIKATPRRVPIKWKRRAPTRSRARIPRRGKHADKKGR